MLELYSVRVINYANAKINKPVSFVSTERTILALDHLTCQLLNVCEATVTSHFPIVPKLGKHSKDT